MAFATTATEWLWTYNNERPSMGIGGITPAMKLKMAASTLRLHHVKTGRITQVLHGHGMAISDAVRQIGVTEPTYYRWRKQYGGMNRDQLKPLKKLETENQRLRRAVSDLTLDKMILREAARGNFQALHAFASASIMCGMRLAYPSAAPAAPSGSTT